MLKKAFLSLIVACLTASIATAAPSPEALIRANLEKAGQTIEAVKPSPIPGLYTVTATQGVLYVDAAGKYVLQGQLYDMQTRENLTEAHQVASLPKVDWRTLDLRDAIKTVKGNGKRKLVVFSDPDCPYCRMLEEKSLAKVNDVTIYTFLYPLASLHPEAARKARQIWCAPDRAKAWDDWMLRNKLPSNDGNCQTPIDRNITVAQRLRINGTPGLIFSDGTQLPGARQPEVIEQRLGKAN